VNLCIWTLMGVCEGRFHLQRKFQRGKFMSWIQYWKEDSFWSKSPLWRAHANVFSGEVQKVLSFTKESVVMDIGCGPGFIARKIAPLVKRFYALDINEDFLKITKNNCESLANVETRLLREDYQDFPVPEEKVDIFLCVSVIQYFSDFGSVKKLIESCGKIASPKAKILIADIPLKRNFSERLFDSLFTACRSVSKGYFFPFIQTGIASRFFAKDYVKALSENAEMLYTLSELRELFSELRMKNTFFTESFSVCSGRPNVLIEL